MNNAVTKNKLGFVPIAVAVGTVALVAAIFLLAPTDADATWETSGNATIHAKKIICDDEQYLPDGQVSNPITSTTATDWVAQNSEHCWLTDNWNFEWRYGGNSYDADDWNQFSVSNPATVGTGQGRIETREVWNDNYIPFTGTGGSDVTAEFYCYNDVTNYDNWEWLFGLQPNTNYYCVGFNVPKPATVHAQKVVCENEADLPNSGTNGLLKPITASTAQDWVDAHEGCELVDWDFEWIYDEDTFNPGDNTVNSPSYNDFPGNSIELYDLGENNKIWVREVWNDTYIPFTYGDSGNSDDVTAEFYCHTDVLNYDNWEWIDNLQYDQDYYCVGFNVVAPFCGDGKVNQIEEQCDGTDGITEGENFCSTQCELIPIYDGGHECSEGKIAVETDLGKEILGTNPNAATINTVNGQEYLFEVSGTYQYANNTDRQADGAYATTNNWSSLRTNIGAYGTEYRGVTSLLSDMSTGTMGVVDWGAYNDSHLYTKRYTPSGPTEFVISDWYSDWYNNGCSGQSCFGDNSGSLELTVYECQVPSYIQGKKFNDENGNGTREKSEPFMNDWTIRLYNSDWDQVGSNHYTGETGTLGQYRFEDLGLDTYYVCEVQQEGWAQTRPSSIANQSGAADEAPYCFKVKVSKYDKGYTWKQFGNQQLYDLHGYKWNDLNGNGKTDCEPLLSGWTIQLKQDGEVIDEMETSGEKGEHYGWYWFENLPAGTYEICEVLKEGWYQTYPSETKCHTVTFPMPYKIACTQNLIFAPEFNFGNYEMASLKGKKCEDPNGNGDFLPGHGENDCIPLEGWEIQLYQNLEDTEPFATAYTNANGVYKFSNLMFGKYFVKEVMQEGWIQTRPLIPFNQDYHVVKIEEAGKTYWRNFGNYLAQCGNGILDEGEACDDGAMNGQPGYCDYECSGNTLYCGDGIITEQLGEECDAEGVACTTDDGYAGFRECYMGSGEGQSDIMPWCMLMDCVTEEFCGDGIMNGTEECDGGDDCTEQCMLIPAETKTQAIVLEPILTIDKVVGEATVKPSDTVTYTVTVANTGDVAALSVSLDDILPEGFTFSVYETDTYTWDIGDISVGEDVTVTYDVVVGKDVADGTYENLAVASADNYGNVSDKEPVKVELIPIVLGEEAPVLTITKTVDVETANPNATVNYEVVVTNIGGVPAMNAMLHDTLDKGLVFAGTVTETTSQWELGDIVPTESVTILYEVTVLSNATDGVYNNAAVASADDVTDVSAQTDLEVVTIKVLGAEDTPEELPVTGAGIFSLISIGAVLIGTGLLSRKKTK